MKQTLIGSFNKNSMEIVKVYIQTWKARDYVDIRVWYLEDPASPGAEKPSHKGLTLSVELLPKLRQVLQKAEAAIQEGPGEERGDVL